MARTEETSRIVTPNEVAQKMVLDYSRGVKDRTTKALEAVCGLCWELEQPDIDVNAFMGHAADMIARLFAIESVAIAARDPVDRLYRYKVVVGLDHDVAEKFKDLVYTREQLLSESTYPSYEISAHTRLFLSEDHPYADDEEFTYRRPALIGMKRRSLTDSLEADYLDIFFNDSRGEILGFIEISGTRLRKMPDVTTIRWIELIAGILGLGLQRSKGYR